GVVVGVGDARDGFAGETRFVVVLDVVRVGVEEVEQLDVDIPFLLPVAGAGVEDEGIAGQDALVGGEGASAEVAGAERSVGAGGFSGGDAGGEGDRHGVFDIAIHRFVAEA